jgi:hypothetical protein
MIGHGTPVALRVSSGVASLLRISLLAASDQEVTLRLEGRVVGRWVEELRRACAEARGGGGHVTLDLRDVLFLDREAIALLRTLTDQDVAVRRCSPFVAQQLRDAPVAG